MIRIFYYIILFNSFVFTQSGNWNVFQTPVSTNLKNIFAFDSLNIWVAGDSGYILFTSDLGNTWTLQNFRPGFQINDIYFLDQNNGWAIENGTEDGINVDNFILSTTDGGLNWQSRRFRPDNLILYTICFVDQMKGIVGGDNNIFSITTNGGVDWTEIPRDTATFSHFPVHKVRFINDSVGFAVGGIYDRGGVIWHCTNGGFNWMTDSAYADPFFDMVFPDSQTVVALASDIERSFPSAVFKSSDLGNTWFFKEIPYYGVSSGIDNRTSDEIWGTYGQEFIVSTDKGENWVTFPTPDSAIVFDIVFTDSLHGFAVGDSGKFLIYKPTISSVESQLVFTNQSFRLYQNYPNPFNYITNFRIDLDDDSFVNVAVYNSLGEKIQTLFYGDAEKGSIELRFDAKDLASGIYFYSVEMRNKNSTSQTIRSINKMILMK
ncbi:Hypothetical protein IALB_1789 [Ignavibacterium album JCM 16511]|uniref:Secretion system C-terminal sorting domain-containing protein n=1 Tax=Ignavibacterium album (strain DSM 19864 / JCM 16511 / NBRC 101810 / Mat9-16) TaxID=945713 RepID=I0AKI9_IGNAJ|nr:T9SS type A sorting domain-containing protein [Ignavibacterium album]AFH49496.1 Hypothetical protein IALB_1789 [Ignavibacterium album JCM 16511]